MKMYRECPGMLSSENDDFKFLKTAKNIKCTCFRCTVVPGLCNCFISPNQLVVGQKHERSCIMYFPKYRNLFIDAEYIYGNRDSRENTLTHYKVIKHICLQDSFKLFIPQTSQTMKCPPVQVG